MNAQEIAPNSVLPNPSVTWGRNLPDFDVWKKNKNYKFDSDEAAICIYLLELMQNEFTAVNKAQALSDIANTISEKMTLEQSYRGELMYAFLALTIAGDSNPARRFVAGQRLCPGLHIDYVNRTRCYG